jgi:hypothetical protein
VNRFPTEFESLKSEEVFIQGMLASDVVSLYRRLSRAEEVRDVARVLGSNPPCLLSLCEFVLSLVDEPHSAGYRHPNDIAACAALVVLHPSPLSPVRHLFDRLRRLKRAPLAWVQRMAEYCDEGFPGSGRISITLGSSADGVGLTLSPGDESPIEWYDDELQRDRHELTFV